MHNQKQIDGHVAHENQKMPPQISNASEYATESSSAQFFDVRMSKTNPGAKEGSLPLVMLAPHPVRGLTEHSTK